jgi:hypothetical protein
MRGAAACIQLTTLPANRSDAAGISSRGPRSSSCRSPGEGNPTMIALLEQYKSGQAAAGRVAYTAHVRNGAAWAIDELAATLAGRRTCLPCFEHDHRDCHRDVIVEELRARMPALLVQHL